MILKEGVLKTDDTYSCPKPGGLLTILAVGYILEAALDTKRFIPVNWQGSATWLWGKLIVNVTLQP